MIEKYYIRIAVSQTKEEIEAAILLFRLKRTMKIIENSFKPYIK